jgi:Na+/proline symporter
MSDSSNRPRTTMFSNFEKTDKDFFEGVFSEEAEPMPETGQEHDKDAGEDMLLSQIEAEQMAETRKGRAGAILMCFFMLSLVLQVPDLLHWRIWARFVSYGATIVIAGVLSILCCKWWSEGKQLAAARKGIAFLMCLLLLPLAIRLPDLLHWTGWASSVGDGATVVIAILLFLLVARPSRQVR